MKKTYVTAICLAMVFACSNMLFAQDKSNRPSPPAQATASLEGIDVTIDYSRPSVKGRKIFGELVPFGKVWRTGANESTWIDVSENVKIDGQELPKGRYALFTIPGEDSWTIIFNKKWQDWGAYKYDESLDALRIDVKSAAAESATEMFTIAISDGGKTTLSWENTMVAFNISK